MIMMEENLETKNTKKQVRLFHVWNMDANQISEPAVYS